MEARRFKPPRWPLAVILVAVIVFAAVGWYLLNGPAETVSTPTMQPVPTDITSVPSTPSPVPVVTTPTPTPSPTPSAVIDEGQAVQLYVPSADASVAINDPVLPMPSACRTVIEPPIKGPGIGDVYQCMDFAMPSSHSSSLTILAGHSSNYYTTVFNRLYRQGDALVGREVLIRTTTSGDHWLVYQVQRVETPLKTDLPNRDDIWGTGGTTTAGRLLLVTCFQRADGKPSTNNFIVVAQFVGIR